MIKVYASHDRFFVESLRANLRDAGIEHLIKDESSSSLGEVPPIVSQQHVWVINAADVEDAKSLVAELESRVNHSREEPWVCQSCSEQLEPQFTACWKCGGERDA
ncbi:MAG: DUF2007 domain-containing protein [Deltaproteobacteria bacterium]|jgi:hypothetical protein|nr:DUF2007 domain-containing protein [Deltaproteobacteria bacterium]